MEILRHVLKIYVGNKVDFRAKRQVEQANIEQDERLCNKQIQLSHSLNIPRIL